MRYSLLLAVIVSFLGTAAVPAQDGLFSEVALESVFEKSVAPDPSVATKSQWGKSNRITGVSSLIQALEAAGFKAKEENGRASLDLDHDGWNFPMTIGVQVDQDRIDFEMSIIKISDSKLVTTEILLSLLTAGDGRGAAFAYDPGTKQIQLRASLPNRSVTAGGLKADLVRMATLAAKQSDVWIKLKGQAKSDATTAKPEQAKSVPAESPATGAAPPALTLLGRWSASLASGDAFAIELTSDSKFQLVHLKSGKSTISKGKTTRTGNQLKLVGDNTTLNCQVTQTTANTFQLGIQDAKGNVAVKLNFKKAK